MLTHTPEQKAFVDACIRRRLYVGMDKILSDVREGGIDISRSALHRYVQTLKENDAVGDTVVVMVQRSTGAVTTFHTSLTADQAVDAIAGLARPGNPCRLSKLASGQ